MDAVLSSETNSTFHELKNAPCRIFLEKTKGQIQSSGFFLVFTAKT